MSNQSPHFHPTITIPAIMVPQPDGSYNIKAGRPVIDSERIGARRACALLCISPRWFEQLCDEGCFQTARKLTDRQRSHWRVDLAEVLARRAAQTVP
jgi:hypothetical protein